MAETLVIFEPPSANAELPIEDGGEVRPDSVQSGAEGTPPEGAPLEAQANPGPDDAEAPAPDENPEDADSVFEAEPNDPNEGAGDASQDAGEGSWRGMAAAVGRVFGLYDKPGYS